jgi:hypothetical protein
MRDKATVLTTPLPQLKVNSCLRTSIEPELVAWRGYEEIKSLLLECQRRLARFFNWILVCSSEACQKFRKEHIIALLRIWTTII